MKTVLIGFIMIVLSSPLLAQTESDPIKQFEGVWTIDLRPTAESEPYLKEFIVVLDSNKTFQGEFYDSEIQNGLINNSWEKLYFAFSTSDGSNEYYHTGYLLENKVYGVTNCPNRSFVAPWNGIKN